MARPAEKARAMMNKWTAMRDADSRGSGASKPPRRRPYLASDCEFLADAERYRMQIVKEIEKGIAKVQNPALGEHEMRETNDEINRRMREKWHWNKRIKELGGVDYSAIEKQRQIEEGDVQHAHSSGSYRYYGAAKDLPGVRELLAKEAAKHQKRMSGVRKSDVYKRITPDYYGWRDEDDGVLLEIEAMADKKNSNSKRRRMNNDATGEEDNDEQEEEEDYLDIPPEDEIERVLLEHKKKALLAKYAL